MPTINHRSLAENATVEAATAPSPVPYHPGERRAPLPCLAPPPVPARAINEGRTLSQPLPRR
jgi:hypothetical protein